MPTETTWKIWLERLYNLRRDKRASHEHPHKVSPAAHNTRHAMKPTAVIILAVACLAMSLVPKPTESDVTGVWLGTARDHRMIGLQLATNRTGRVCISYPYNDSFYDYQIDRWSLTNFTIRLKTHPRGSDTAPLTFGRIDYSRPGLSIEIDKEKIDLWREQDWQSRAAAVKRRMADPSK